MNFYSFKDKLNKLQDSTPIGQSLRFAYFIFFYFFLRYIELLFYSTSFGRVILNPLHERLSFFITHTCCFILQLIYPDIHTSVSHTITIASKTPIQMLPGCTGLGHLLRLSFVLLIYPMSWLKKVLIFPPTVLIVIFASTLHFLLLIPIAYHYPEFYGLAHNYFTRSIFFGFIFLCWIVWEKLRFIPKY
jgi:exosortase/archaeosortase family protein